jgi:hypothetical protein
MAVHQSHGRGEPAIVAATQGRDEKSARRYPANAFILNETGVLRRLATDCCPCNAADIRAVDAEIAQFARGHAAKFGDRLTVLAPIVERACYVHRNPLSWVFEAGCQSVAPWLLR